MDALTVKNKIVEAMAEPSPPEQLIQKTILRARAVSAGCRAEARMEAEGKNLSQKELTELAAVGLVGRMALVVKLPEGAEPDRLASQLLREPRFLKAVEEGNVLARLKNGELLNAALREAPKREPPAPERGGPELGGPMA